MKYAVEMSPGATMYIPVFVKMGSGIQKLIGGNSQAHRHVPRESGTSSP
jgi:hypothetical protein